MSLELSSVSGPREPMVVLVVGGRVVVEAERRAQQRLQAPSALYSYLLRGSGCAFLRPDFRLLSESELGIINPPML